MDRSSIRGLPLAPAAPYGPDVQLRVLGPLEGSVEGRDVPLAGPKQRAVLAHLVVAANQVVPADRLIDRIWGEDPPEAARSALQAYVSRLRKALGAATIEARSPGYVLRARPEEIDSLRFEAMVSEARRLIGPDPAAANAVFEEALALWRGPAFADLAGDVSLQPEIARLEELRLSCREDHAETGLALGRHTDLIPRLETFVAEHPLRERCWAHLMLALYRAGRQGDALGAYQRARRILSDELGVDPSPDVQKLHERLLRQDPTLELAGRRLRGYQLFEQIGEGAFGSVHRALQPEVGREVVVKVFHRWLADRPGFIRRFDQEAQPVARLEHPHIVPLYDYWRDPGGAYLVMRYVRGGNVGERLRTHGPLEPEAAADLLDQLSAALAVAHRQGVVHRDIRPSNLLLDQEGNTYLADFSIAKDLAWTDATAVSSGLMLYMSPEEIRREPVRPATDVYSLGLVLYELLAGRHPFADVPALQVRDRQLSGAIPSISVFRPDLPPAVDEVLGRATAKDPAARHPDALTFASAFRFALEAGTQVAALPAVEVPNPYKGLRPFDESDASDYFGREELTDRLVARLGEPVPGARFLAVVGPSGSGKSSVVRAGLIPALRRGSLPGSEHWFVAEMHPGTHPFAELEAALLRLAVARRASLGEQLERDEYGLVRAAGWVLPPDGSELLIVIDQFEELFTLVQDPNRQIGFLEILHTAVSAPESRVRVVVALRADFYDRPLLYKAVGDLLGDRTQTVTAQSPEELEQAIVGPAGRVGVTVEPGLLAKVLGEATDQPGALPLFQYALTELFERREDSTLRLDAYHEMGGVLEALGRRAEEMFARLDQTGKEAARQLFLRLVTVGDEGTAETRRRVLRSELTSIEVDRASMERVIDVLDSRRLLTLDRDPVTRGPTVEVAHEALLREWGRLRGWMESAHEDVRMHRRLAAGASEWEAAGREPSFLLRGEQLSRFEGRSSTSGLALTDAERRYLLTSTAAQEAERAEEEVRKAREAALERRSRTRLRARVAVFAVAAHVASTLTAVALNQRERARSQARVATARELAAASLANLEVDPELSILLALEAVRTTRSVDGTVLSEAEDVLHRAMTSSRIVATMPGAGTIVDSSQTGEVLAFAGGEDPGTVELRDAAHGDPVRSWAADSVAVNDLAFSPDGSQLATAGSSGITLWELATGEARVQLAGQLGTTSGVSFSEDGRFVSGLSSGEAVVWDVTTGRRVGSIPVGGLFVEVTALSPDGSQLAVADDVAAEVFDVATGQPLGTLGGHVFNVIDVDWSPDGSRLATSSLDFTVRVWDPGSGRLLNTLAGDPPSADWSADGSRLVVGEQVWEVGPGGDARALFTLAGHGATLEGVAFGSDGNKLVTTDVAGTAKIWDLSISGDAEWINFSGQDTWFNDVTFSPDGEQILASFRGSTARVWDVSTGREVLTLPGHREPGFDDGEGVAGIAVSPDGRLIATAGRDLTARVWEARTGTEVFAVEHNSWVEEVRFSPDGKLLATASIDGTSQIVDVGTRRVLHSLSISSIPEIPFALVSVQFAADGRSIVSGSWDGSVRVWDAESGVELHRIEIGSPVDGLALSPDGEMVAVVAGESASLWDLGSGERVAALAGRSIVAVAFSPDGTRVATGGWDGLVRVSHLAPGVPDEVLVAHDGVMAVTFSPDGSRLASFDERGLIRVWAVDLDDLIGIARREITRSLADEECRRYLHVDACP